MKRAGPVYSVTIAILSLLLTILLGSCSKYYHFDELYDKNDYLNAYRVLENIKENQSINYKRRLYRIVIRMSIDGDPDFILKMENLALQPHTADIKNYADFAGAISNYLDAKSPPQFQSVADALSNIHYVPVEFLPYAYKIRGISLYHLGKFDDSIADLTTSEKMLPFADNLYYIGMCYYYKNDIKTSIEYFQRVSEGASDGLIKSAAYYQLGEIANYQGSYAEALTNYFQAINNYSQNADYSYKIAKCLQKLKYTSLSQKFLKISLRIQKDYANAWFFLNIY